MQTREDEAEWFESLRVAVLFGVSTQYMSTVLLRVVLIVICFTKHGNTNNVGNDIYTFPNTAEYTGYSRLPTNKAIHIESRCPRSVV